MAREARRSWCPLRRAGICGSVDGPVERSRSKRTACRTDFCASPGSLAMTKYSLAQLTALNASPPELVRIAGSAGYDCVGLRLLEVTGGDAWPLASDRQLMRDTKDAMAIHDVSVLDIELVRLTPDIRIEELRPTLDAAAELGARHVLTQSHDGDWARLVHNFGTLCDLLSGYGLTADVEFLTWT